jgi:hypothetical protein
MEINVNDITENPCTHGWPRMFVDKINVNPKKNLPKNDPLNLEEIFFRININLLNISLHFTPTYIFLIEAIK